MITVHELAVHRGIKSDVDGGYTAGAYYDVGLDIMGGCECCHASIAAYNAYPSQSGFWRCADCIGDDGWESAEEANAAIFGEAKSRNGRCARCGNIQSHREGRIEYCSSCGGECDH